MTQKVLAKIELGVEMYEPKKRAEQHKNTYDSKKRQERYQVEKVENEEAEKEASCRNSKEMAVSSEVKRSKEYNSEAKNLANRRFKVGLEMMQGFNLDEHSNLKLNAEKCRLGLSEIDYLGYIVTPKGIRPNPKKIKAIQALERPQTVTDVRRLIGMVQYYRDMAKTVSYITTIYCNFLW